MSDNDTTTPNAEQPTTVCQKLYKDGFVEHVSGEVNLTSHGSEFEVKAWVDDEKTAGLVAEVAKQMQRSGYDIDSIGTVESTSSVKIKAEATTDE